ncbi:MAG: amidohydrolase family protein, partial [Pseudomonadota bacterium]
FTLDDRFAGQILTPGFVDPHLHLWLSTLLISQEFITPADWQLPWGDAKGVTTEEAFWQRLAEVEASHPVGEPLFVWGYHQYFHGKSISRDKLNALSEDRPVIVWHRSFHELFFNDAATDYMGWTEADWTGEDYAYKQMDWDRGHLFENGGLYHFNTILEKLIESGLFARGAERTVEYLRAGGITSAVDPGIVLPPDVLKMLNGMLEQSGLPMDVWLIPAGNATYMEAEYDADKGKAAAEALVADPALSTEHIRWLPKSVKLFSDGAMYSQLMMMKDGYTDGHEGEWLQYPDQLLDSWRPYWEDGYLTVIHANGDYGFEVAVDHLETLQAETPRQDHRTSYHHLGFTDLVDIERAQDMDANFSVNPYYVHILGERYGEVGIGRERANTMSRGRSFLDVGGVLSYHSDAPMAPARPLSLMWAAVSRQGLSGKTLGPEEKVTPEEALYAITLGAAYASRLEHEVGSIEPGKLANFAVLDDHPFEVAPERLNEIRVAATVHRGEVHETDGFAGFVINDTNLTLARLMNRVDAFQGRGDFCGLSRNWQQRLQ